MLRSFIFQGKTLQIAINNGIVRGRKAVTERNVTYWAFQGIPYAKPPTGNLRFRVSFVAKTTLPDESVNLRQFRIENLRPVTKTYG